MLKGQALPLLHRARIVGCLTVAALLLMGVFAGVAHASSVTSVSVTNSAPTDATGARTVYSISFNTSSTGGLSAAANSAITITFPSGTGLSNVNSSQILTATSQNIGSCSLNQTNLTATCGFFSNETVAAGASLTVQLGGVANPPPPPPGSLQSVTVKTTADTTAVAASFPIVANNPITKLSVTNSTPTDAAGGRTVYSITFDTSSTGAMSTLGNSAITITFPTGTGLTNVNSSQILSGGQNIGSCSLSQSTLTASCGFFSSETVGAGSPLTVVLGGVTNPPVNPTGGQTQSLTVQTTSDTGTVGASFPVVANNTITKLSAVNSTPTDAAGGRTVYSITFDTSSTGAMSTLANSAITITFPTGTGLTNVNSSQILTATNQNIGSCSLNQTNLTANCGFFSNETVAAGAPLTVVLGGVTNPPVNPNGGQTQSLMVQTTSDTSPVSASFPVAPNNRISQPVVSLSNAAPGAGAITYSVAFTTSSTGGLSTLANSAITITFPTGTGLTNVNSSQILTATNQNIGSCSLNQTNLTATCGFFSNETVGAGAPLTVVLGGVTNPPTAGPRTLMVQTTSDPTSVTSGQYNIGGQPPAPAVTGISPSSGPTGGGTNVTISGTNLTGATTVDFGSNGATNVTLVNASEITATSPPGSGTVDVTVTTPSGTSATVSSDRFTYNALSPPPPPPPPPSSPPVVSVGAPTAPSSNGAALSGLVDPGSLATTAFFQYGLDPADRGPGASTTLFDQSTTAQQVGSDAASHTVSATLSGLVPGALYHVRLVATNSAGTTLGPDQTFTTPAAPAPAPPVLGQTENAQPVSGTVFIRLASGQFVRLTGAQQIPSSAVIDALHGTLKLTTATGGGTGGARDAAAKGKKPKTKTQSGTFGGAIFKVTQARAGATKGLTTLALLEAAFKGAPSYALCTKHTAGDASAAAVSSKVLQLLHASAHGKFRTSGRYSAATVRGTIWTVADRCDGTLTHDVTDSVAVADFVRHKTIILHAGQSYLAKASPHAK